MAKRTPPTDKNNQNVSYTMIPNEVLRSRLLTAYDKLVYALIESCNPSFPSYQAIRKWSGLSRDRIWKSLRNLEKNGLIKRFKSGRSIYYLTHYTSTYNGPIDAPQVRYTDSTSPYYGRIPVRNTDPKKNNEKEQRKSEDLAAPGQKEGKEIIYEDPDWLKG